MYMRINVTKFVNIHIADYAEHNNVIFVSQIMEYVYDKILPFRTYKCDERIYLI